jgi:MFS family permease
VLCAAVVAVLAVWFAGTAAVPALLAEARITPAQAGWLTGAVQLGFVAGTLISAVLGLADRMDNRLLFAACAADAGLATLALPLVDPAGFWALALRFLAGASVAGVYPVAMKLASGWATPGPGGDLGVLIGLVVGAVTLGSAVPHAIPPLLGLPDWRLVFFAAGALALLGAVLIFAFRSGPIVVRRPPFRPAQALLAFQDPGLRLANLGYLGHMWELYAMWTWVGLWLAGVGYGGLATFAVVGIGAVGCVLAGVLADRWDRAGTAALSMLVSGSCAVIAVPASNLAPVLGLLVALVWGLAVVADSAQFSASVVRLSPPAVVGTMLTVQTCLGFLLTVVMIRAVPALADRVGWQGAFAVLALGPALGAMAMLRLRPILHAKESEP